MSRRATESQLGLLTSLLNRKGLSIDSPAEQLIVRKGRDAVSERITELKGEVEMSGGYPASEAQLRFLRNLHYSGPEPKTMKEASDAIRKLRCDLNLDDVTERQQDLLQTMLVSGCWSGCWY